MASSSNQGSNPRKHLQEYNRMACTPSQSSRFSLEQHDNSQIKGTTSSLQTSSLEEFQMTVDKLNERDLEVKRARYELTLKTRSLDDKKERNRQTILELQMKSEHESGQLEELTKHRETLQQRMHYVFGIGESFRRHQDSINETLSQLTKRQGLLEQMSNESSDTLRLINLKAQEVMPHKLSKIRHLLSELEEGNHQSKKLAEELNQTSLFYKRHDDAINSLKTKCDLLDMTLKEKTSELTSLKENSRCQTEAEQNKLELFDKEIEDLDALVTEAKTKYENLNLKHETLQNEKECCLSYMDVAQKGIDSVRKSISAVEAEKHLLEQKEREIRDNLSEREMELRSSSEHLSRLQTQHDGMYLQLTSLQEKSQQTAEEKLHKILELNEEIAMFKSTSSTRLNELHQALQLAATDTDQTTQMIQNTKGQIHSAKSELQTARNLKNELESENSQLNNLIIDQNSVMQNLQSELERLQKSVTDERERVSDLQKLHLEQEESIGQEEKTLQSKLEEAKEKVLKTQQCVHDSKDALASVHQEFENMRRESFKKQESTNHHFSSKKVDLQEEIKLLTDLKNKTAVENERVLSNLSKDLDHKTSLLAVHEEKIMTAHKVIAALQKEVCISKQTLVDHGQEISATEESEVTMNQTLKNLQKDAHEVEKQLLKWNAHYLEQSTISKAKSEEIISLRNAMDTFEIAKNEALFKNSADMKSLLCEMVESKQTCESLLSQTSQLNSEIDSLKKNYAVIKQEIEAIQNSILSFNTKAQHLAVATQQKKGLLGKLRGDLEKSQKRAQRAALELKSYKDEHQSLVNQIQEAKARKRARLAGASALEEQKTRENTFQITTPQAPSTPLANTPHASTPQAEDQKNTPKSILKSTKNPTPQSAKKSVSFVID